MTKNCTCGAIADDGTTNSGSYNVGEFARKTGFSAVFSHDGGIIWFCPICSGRLAQLARNILAITKDQYINFGSLLKLKLLGE